MGMEFYEIDGEFLEVLKAIRIKRKCSFSSAFVCQHFVTLLDFGSFREINTQMSKVSKNMIGLYGLTLTRLLQKGW